MALATVDGWRGIVVRTFNGHRSVTTKEKLRTRRYAAGSDLLFCISGVFACGGASALTAADWVGTYAGSDTVSLTDGGTGTVMFDVQVAAGDIYNSV